MAQNILISAIAQGNMYLVGRWDNARSPRVTVFEVGVHDQAWEDSTHQNNPETHQVEVQGSRKEHTGLLVASVPCHWEDHQQICTVKLWGTFLLKNKILQSSRVITSYIFSLCVFEKITFFRLITKVEWNRFFMDFLLKLGVFLKNLNVWCEIYFLRWNFTLQSFIYSLKWCSFHSINKTVKKPTSILTYFLPEG